MEHIQNVLGMKYTEKIIIVQHGQLSILIILNHMVKTKMAYGLLEEF